MQSGHAGRERGHATLDEDRISDHSHIGSAGGSRDKYISHPQGKREGCPGLWAVGLLSLHLLHADQEHATHERTLTQLPAPWAGLEVMARLVEVDGR